MSPELRVPSPEKSAALVGAGLCSSFPARDSEPGTHD